MQVEVDGFLRAVEIGELEVVGRLGFPDCFSNRPDWLAQGRFRRQRGRGNSRQGKWLIEMGQAMGKRKSGTICMLAL